MILRPSHLHRLSIISLNPARRTALAVTIAAAGMALPAPGLEAQDALPGPRHADHAELHHAGPSEPALELLAAETLRPRPDGAGALSHRAQLALAAGILTRPEAEKRSWYRRAEALAREARALDPSAVEPLFLETSAVGLQADIAPLRERIRAADRVLHGTRRILALDPDHPGGLHLNGRLNAAAMRAGRVARFVVGTILGSDALDQATWDAAEASFRGAVAGEPLNPVHRIELAMLLRDTGRPEAARAELRHAVRAPGDDALTRHWRARARRELADLR